MGRRVFFLLLLTIFNVVDAHADVVFPAISKQFAVTLVLGNYWAFLMAVTILAIEAVFIKKLFSCHIVVAFIASFGINFISSFVGILLSIFSFSGNHIFAYGNKRLGAYLGMGPGYVMTVIIELIVLLIVMNALKQKIRFLACLKTSILMNFCSYALLLAGIFIADVLTHGDAFRY